MPSDCGDDQLCLGGGAAGTCTALCDGTHDCPIIDADAGAPMCSPLPGVTTGTCG